MDDRRKLELAGWALAAVVAVFLAARLLHHGGGGSAPVAVSTAAPHTTPQKPAGPLVVDVEGEVAQPGIQHVAAGSRIAAAVDAAGGISRRGDPAGVNLAAPLQDGQQIVVPRRGAAVAAGAESPAGGSGARPAPISLSNATVAQLDTLDGIGPTLAQRIVQYRASHGGFRSVDQLKQVEGIGEKRFASLKAALQP
jgi:competence protein ComEA